VLRAEGVALGGRAREAAVEQALEQAGLLAEELAAA